MEMGQWVMGQMGYHLWMSHVGQGSLPVTRLPIMMEQQRTRLQFLLLVDIEKLLTHSISPIIIAEGLILIYDFFALKTSGVSSTTVPRCHAPS